MIKIQGGDAYRVLAGEVDTDQKKSLIFDIMPKKPKSKGKCLQSIDARVALICLLYEVKGEKVEN